MFLSLKSPSSLITCWEAKSVKQINETAFPFLSRNILVGIYKTQYQLQEKKTNQYKYPRINNL